MHIPWQGLLTDIDGPHCPSLSGIGLTPRWQVVLISALPSLEMSALPACTAFWGLASLRWLTGAAPSDIWGLSSRVPEELHVIKVAWSSLTCLPALISPILMSCVSSCKARMTAVLSPSLPACAWPESLHAIYSRYYRIRKIRIDLYRFHTWAFC